MSEWGYGSLHDRGGYYFDSLAEKRSWAELAEGLEDERVLDAVKWYRRVEMGGGLRDMTRGAVLLHVGALINHIGRTE